MISWILNADANRFSSLVCTIQLATMQNLRHILEEAQAVVSCSDIQLSFGQEARNMSPSSAWSSSPDVKAVAHKVGNTLKKRTWKKPADKPKRPLSAYNLFFQHEREKLLASLPGDSSVANDGLMEEERRKKHRKTHGKIGFADLVAKQIANEWKNIDSSSRSVFESRAEIEKKRYLKELDAWKRTQIIEEEKVIPKKEPSPKTRTSSAM
jgi:hypothetical protein